MRRSMQEQAYSQMWFLLRHLCFAFLAEVADCFKRSLKCRGKACHGMNENLAAPLMLKPQARETHVCKSCTLYAHGRAPDRNRIISQVLHSPPLGQHLHVLAPEEDAAHLTESRVPQR